MKAKGYPNSVHRQDCQCFVCNTKRNPSEPRTHISMWLPSELKREVELRPGTLTGNIVTAIRLWLEAN